MFKKLKERISVCENRIDSNNANIQNIYQTIMELHRNTTVEAKHNADILLDCLAECQDRTRIFVDGVQTMYEVDRDTTIVTLYRKIYKAMGHKKVTIYSYEIKGGSVNFTVWAGSDTSD